MCEVDAAPQDRGREAGQVADHAAAEGDDEIAALDAFAEKPFGQLFQFGERLCAFTRCQADCRMMDACAVETLFECGQMKCGDGFVGHDGDALAPQEGLQMFARIRDQSPPDEDVVGAVA